MLDETLVIWGGEFGRTPVIQAVVKLGRIIIHMDLLWMAAVASKGTVYGSTDELGFHAQENKNGCMIFTPRFLKPWEWIIQVTYQGRDFSLLTGGRVIDEIIL